MILSICDVPDVLKVMRIVKTVITLIRIIVPILLIVSVMIDFVRAVTNAELNKITKPMINKVIAAILVFLIPTFVRLITFIAGASTEYEKCLGDITSETIEIAYNEQAEKLVKKAEETLKESDYNAALAYLIYVTDLEVKDEYTKRLEKVKEKIEETKKPKALAVIKPDSKENIIKQEETDTLKVYITKQNNYYVTRIWMVNPYKQVNKQDSDNYGKTLTKPSELLKNAINSKNLDNKLIVGINASGFYLRDTYDAYSVSKYPAFDKTSVGTIVITDGKVVRNAYDKAYKTWFIAGVDKNNTLRIFTDKQASSDSELNEKRTWAQQVIDSKIRNTFTFASPLVIDGKRSDITTSMPSSTSKVNRQAICQINTNNFALVTGSSLNREDLINIMLDLNCKTATNLDGGGSIALLFKSKSSNDIETIMGNSRALPEAVYFTE